MRRTVAVGESLRDAGRICGAETTATDLLTWADVERGDLPSLAAVETLVLGAGAGLDDLVRTACSGLDRGEPQVLEVALEGAAALRTVLAEDRELAVLGARPVPGGLVVRIGRLQVPQDPSATALDVLEELAARGIGRTSTALDDGASEGGRPHRTPAPPAGVGAGLGARRTAVALGGAVVLAALAVAVAAVVGGPEAADRALLGCVLAGQLAIALGVVLVLRRLGALRAEQGRRDRRLRTMITKRTDRLRVRNEQIRADVQEIAVLKEYALELGRQQSATARAVEELRTLLDEQGAEQGVR